VIPDVATDREANRGFVCFLLGFCLGGMSAAALAVPGLLLVLWWVLRK
jgi:hypothetical protein